MRVSAGDSGIIPNTVFSHLKTNLNIEIRFPYPYLNSNYREVVSSEDFWDPSDDQINSLNAGEINIRSYTVKFLSQFKLDNKIIYDPACSTGEFLGTIKRNFPNTYTIGQDFNKKMADFATKNSPIDKVYHGDSAVSTIKDNSVDIIFFRFLNLEVTTTQQACQ